VSLPQTLDDVADLKIVSDFARELYAATVAQMVCAARAANGRALSDDETADIMRAAIQVVQQVCRVGKQERPVEIARLTALGFKF
jgi:dihydrodipicolinate synthase/N-acetylneuraminate lyase